MINNLELQEDLCHFVVVADYALRFSCLQNSGTLLEEVHWFLDLVEELACPQDLTSYWRQVTSQRRVIFLLSVQFRDHLNVMTIVLKDFLVFFINAKIGDF